MTDIIKIVGGGDYEPNLEELGLKPYNSEKLVIGQKSDVIELQAVWGAVAAAELIALGGAILTGVLAWLATIGQDVAKREAFTKTFVEEANKQFPDYNVVIIHTQHRVVGDFVKDHVELPMTFGTCGYEIYYSLRGQMFELTNDGDGGYRNWAYCGWYTRNGSTISAT